MTEDYKLNPENDLDTEVKQANLLMRIIYIVPRKARIVLCILLATTLAIILLGALKPEAKKRAIPETVVRVDTISAQRDSYPILVSANGTIEAETRGELVAQIRGEIVATSENFKTGGIFKKGDVLIEIDRRDYQADASRALATLSQSEANFRREQANAKQAVLDWKRLGNTEPAPDLVLRKPQLAAAQAELDGARASYDSAQLNLSRTKITAPYDGRIIERNAVLGQYLAVGTPIAEVFATDGVEVRLPISQEEFSQLGLDSFDGQADLGKYKVQITNNVGGQEYSWDAFITRTDSTFDINTRQIDVIAEVSDPFSSATGRPPLKIGQFVKATITGRTVSDVFVIPNKSIREGSYVYAVRDKKLTKQAIKIFWQDDHNALVADGLSDGEMVVTTALNSTLAGATAKLTSEKDESSAKTSSGAQKEKRPSSEENTADSASKTSNKQIKTTSAAQNTPTQ